ncbi:MAG: hypothetical protein QXN75_07035 [Thermoproteota archaeon]|nr:hypothetical protein [Candidatus Brockarchaeota archaeon]
MHVCGRLSSGSLNVLSRIKRVNVLSLEFAGSPANIDLLPKSTPKKIGVGCTRSSIASFNELTFLEQSLEVINNVASKIGRENIAYIHPDCGLRRTSLDLTTMILKNISLKENR